MYGGSKFLFNFTCTLLQAIAQHIYQSILIKYVTMKQVKEEIKEEKYYTIKWGKNKQCSSAFCLHFMHSVDKKNSFSINNTQILQDTNANFATEELEEPY